MSNSDNITPIIQASSVEFLSKNFVEDNYNPDLFKDVSYADFNELRNYPIGTKADKADNKVADVDQLAVITEDVKLKLFSDSTESNLVEIPAYVSSNALANLTYEYYPLDSSLEGFTEEDVSSISDFYRKLETGKVEGYTNITRSLSQTSLRDHGILDYLNEPVFTPEGLSTLSSSKNLLTSPTAEAPHYNFSLREASNTTGPVLVNLAKEKSLNISYHQNYALSEECFAIDCSHHSYTGSVSFDTPVTSLEAGKPYTFSFYAKLHDSSVHDQISNVVASIYTANNNLKARGALNVLIPATITKNWCRLQITVDPVATSNYYFTINFNVADIADTVLLSGILLEESSFPTTYDTRKHSLNFKNTTALMNITPIALLNLASREAVRDPNWLFSVDSKWLISYKRFVSSSSNTCLDSLSSNISWGYKEGVAEFINQPIAVGNISDSFLDSWEQVFIWKANNVLNYKVVSLKDGSYYTATYTLKDTDVFQPICSCLDKSCAPSFQLGSTGSINVTGRAGTNIKLYKGLYRDLIFVPTEDISSIIDVIESSIFSLRSYRKNDSDLVALYASRISEV